MQSRALLLLGLALVFGGLAAYFVSQLVRQPDAPTAQDEIVRAPSDAVVVANRDIPRGETLTQEMLRLVQLPGGSYPATAFRSIDAALENPPVLAMTELTAGEIVLPNRLSTGSRSRGLVGRIPDGYRAIAIPVNAVRGVAGFVLPDTRVDILHTTSVGRLDEQPVTRTLLQGVTVLSINQEASEFRDEPMVATVVNLLASPDDAKSLILAQEVGQLNLALRNDTDEERVDPAQLNTITLRDLWVLTPAEQAAAAEAARRRAAPRTVGIIRGVDIREQTVSPD
jgi:pilus assembly protein CpaB